MKKILASTKNGTRGLCRRISDGREWNTRSSAGRAGQWPAGRTRQIHLLVTAVNKNLRFTICFPNDSPCYVRWKVAKSSKSRQEGRVHDLTGLIVISIRPRFQQQSQNLIIRFCEAWKFMRCRGNKNFSSYVTQWTWIQVLKTQRRRLSFLFLFCNKLNAAKHNVNGSLISSPCVHVVRFVGSRNICTWILNKELLNKRRSSSLVFINNAIRDPQSANKSFSVWQLEWKGEVL